MKQEQEHVCTAVECPDIQRYYVSARNAGQTWLMAGPYMTHKEALARVNQTRDIADKHDGRAWFMAWGTVRMPWEYSKPGTLNKLGLIDVEAA
jgi:hypothetical protein